MSTGTNVSRSRWAEAWPDALAFVAGLALAWFNDWQTKDLVWSLWLSSLVVGYAMIVWFIASSVLAGLGVVRPGGINFRGTATTAALVFGGLFMLGFFTVHFGGFHFVHSVFLNAFFPVFDGVREPSSSLYLEVFRNYWLFVLVAIVAEREGFKSKQPFFKKDETPEASDSMDPRPRRKPRNNAGADGLMAPYKNVIRLHLLIFFFAFASFAKLDNFLVYAVVYGVYFFPWRLLKKENQATAAA